MLKKTVTYKDCDNISCTENFYFNLTEAEILELQVSRAGGYAESMQVLVDSKDPQLILSVIKEFVLSAYGERGEVSRKFSKKRDDTEAFSHTEAFSIIFMDLFKNADHAADFFNGLMPEGMMEAGKAEQAKQEMNKKSDGIGRRPVPQDHQKKVETGIHSDDDTVMNYPAYTTAAKIVEVDKAQTDVQVLSVTSFVALNHDEQATFLRNNGAVVPDKTETIEL